METLSARFVEGLARGTPDPALLARVGDADPEAAAAAFARAARHPDLAGAVDVWAPALLRSARPGFGAGCLEELASRARSEGAPFDPARAPALPRVLASSNFLARVLLRRPHWAAEVAGARPSPPETADGALPDRDWTAIRQAKYRGLLRIAARDLSGRPFAEGLGELSDLADGCLRAGLETAAEETGVEPPALFALGKLGGRELNFSSDVDVLFVYEVPPDRDGPEHNHRVARLVRAFKRGLEERTVEGFAYRVDLDLRPEGKAGVVANSVDAALSYYESFGAEWERQMLIRLRPIAGPTTACERFASGVAPFVYRRLIDPGVMRAVRDMKIRIEDERRRAGRDLEVELKEGPGGIRDVEFLVQSFQLFHGGREPTLRSGNVLDTLAALAKLALLPEAVTGSLAGSYTWLRRAEHALQLAEEQQTARFPRESRAQLELARRMGYEDAEGETARDRLLEDWTAVRNEVRAHFEALVLSPEL